VARGSECKWEISVSLCTGQRLVITTYKEQLDPEEASTHDLNDRTLLETGSFSSRKQPVSDHPPLANELFPSSPCVNMSTLRSSIRSARGLETHMLQLAARSQPSATRNSTSIAPTSRLMKACSWVAQPAGRIAPFVLLHETLIQWRLKVKPPGLITLSVLPC
jgi:hypothetical protein